jgi:hypothetical protein
MTKKKIAIAVVLLLAIGLAGYWWLYGRDASEQAPDQPTVSQTELPPLTSERARELEALLSSGSKAEQARAFVLELRQGEWVPTDIVPVGVTIHIDEGSFVVDEQGARVNVIAEGAQSEIFVARLAYEENTWLIVETISE